MGSNWVRPEGDHDDEDRAGRSEQQGVVSAEPPADDRWLEEGLERRRARRKRLDVADEEG
jgi:hypothetical protein